MSGTRIAVTTVVICLFAAMGSMAVPLMAEASVRVVLGTGMASIASTGAALMIALGLDPRSSFGASLTGKGPQ